MILRAARAIFMLERKLAMLHISNAPQKKRQGVGDSCSVLLHYIQPAKLISDSYPNKDTRDVICGTIITRRDVIRVTRREQLCIFMKHEDFGDHKLHSFQKWFRVIREGSVHINWNIVKRRSIGGRLR